MSTTTNDAITSYGSSFHTANPLESYPSSVFDVDTSSSSSASVDYDKYTYLANSLASNYLAELEAQKEAQATAITEKYEIAKESALEDKNNMISLALQEYLKNINPYGTQSEALSAYGFDSSGGYSVSNAQSSYANYVGTQNSANNAYTSAITELAMDEIDAHIENGSYYDDLEKSLWSTSESILDSMTSEASKTDSTYQQNVLSALEFVETLYNISPTKVATDNSDLSSYVERVYGISGEDFEFVINSVANVLGTYGYYENEYWK